MPGERSPATFSSQFDKLVELGAEGSWRHFVDHHQGFVEDHRVGHDGPIVAAAPWGSGRTRWLAICREAGHDPALLRDDVDADEVVELLADRRSWRIATGPIDPAVLHRIGDSVDILGRDELWLSSDQIAELVRPVLRSEASLTAAAQVIHEETLGWPVHVAAVLEALSTGERRIGDLEHTCTHGGHIDRFLVRLWADLDLDQRRFAALLALIGPVSDRVLHVLGDSAAGPLVVPLVDAGPGCRALPPVVRRFVGALVDDDATQRPDPPDPARLAAALLSSQGLADALGALHRLGRSEQAADLLVDEADRDLALPADPELRTVANELVAALDSRSDLLLCQAQLTELAARFDEAERLYRHLEACDDPVVAEEARLRRLAMAAMVSSASSSAAGGVADPDRDSGAAPSVPLASTLDAATRRRLGLLSRELEIVSGFNVAEHRTVSRSVPSGRTLAEDLIAAGMPRAATRLLRRLAVGPCIDLWRFAAARDLLDRADALVEAHRLQRSRFVVVFRLVLAAETLDATEFARWEELARPFAEADQSRSITSTYWAARLTHAVFAGDQRAAEFSAARCTEFFGDFAQTPLEAFMRAKAVCALSYGGLAATAREELERLIELRSANELEATMAELTYEARHGDAERALQIAGDETLVHRLVPFERRWQVRLERLIAVRRSGRSLDDEGLPPNEKTQVVEAAAEFGLQRRALSMLPDDLGDTDDGSDVPTLEFRVLGSFLATRGKDSLRVGGGQPAQLMKLLCVRGPVVSVDLAIDSMWPEASLDVGRKRLKNVVNRARELVGADAIERTNDFISLADHVRVDLVGFHERAMRATDPLSRGGLDEAIAALDLVRGPLLAGDLYEPWTEEPRWRTDAVVQSLLELIAGQNRPELGPWISQTGARLEVDDPDWWRAVAQLCDDGGAVALGAANRDRAERLERDL